ncbi:hypothetical protein [Neisseria meningitidis]|uniref:hypothetical protein n=1 Tax=Neisseria meningitidis TaxID=487 RepID=UPI0021C846E6|nr:hypothetical protein [Neisseria meningitidis]
MLSLEIQQEGFTIGGGLVLGGCAGVHLARKESLILTGKTGAGASAIAKCKHWISMDCQFVKAKRRS